MSIGMQIFYYSIDIIVTFFYYACQIYVLANVVDHKKHMAKTIFIYAVEAVMSAYMTQASVPVIIKSPLLSLMFIILYRLLLTEKVAAVAVHIVYLDLSTLLQEDIIIFVCKLNNFVPWVDVGHGVQLGKARVILISSLIQLVLTLVLKRVLKSTLEMTDEKNMWFFVFVGGFLFAVQEVFKQLFYRFVEGSYLFVGIVSQVGIVVVGTILYIVLVRIFYLKQKQREERFRMEALEKQFAYYRDKQKDEEQVRSVYHDMKNHLLVLEHQIHSPETAEMVEKLQRKVESYSDYVHTGNDFLDVIIKDKARIAREKQIEFSAVIDMHGMDFIEPLDISTIFGNGLDNAMEACEKLPDGQGVVSVKVERAEDLLSILMENSCLEERIQEKKHAGKKDGRLTGFGIPNMKNAAEKYGGQLTTQCEDGKFTLKILIPIP